MLRVLERVYETWIRAAGDAIPRIPTLGKFPPDQDRPNEGVFSIKDEDNQWLSAAL